VAEVINFVLRAAGCHIKIDENDIADPDNCPNRLGEIQEEYQAVGVEPPLCDAHALTRNRKTLRTILSSLEVEAALHSKKHFMASSSRSSRQ
jgi:hypothetical protein